MGKQGAQRKMLKARALKEASCKGGLKKSMVWTMKKYLLPLRACFRYGYWSLLRPKVVNSSNGCEVRISQRLP